MTSPVKKRLIKFLLSLIVLAISILIIVYNLRDNIVYFYSPSELQDLNTSDVRILRLGGLVSTGSIQSEPNGIHRFKINDGNEEISVKFEGILPNLFAEDKGVVVEGKYVKDELFIALKVLAKHDENYMPPEVIDSLKQTGNWQGE